MKEGTGHDARSASGLSHTPQQIADAVAQRLLGLSDVFDTDGEYQLWGLQALVDDGAQRNYYLAIPRQWLQFNGSEWMEP